MKPARPGSSFPATRAAKLLIGLPLLLAAFALALQVRCGKRSSCSDRFQLLQPTIRP